MRGVTVTLYETTEQGRDAFNAPIIKETATTIDNVLIGEPSTDDYTSAVSVYGKQIRFMLGIPKGDTHDWKDKIVQLPAPFSCQVKTFGFVETGIQDLIPLAWGGKVAAERFE